MAAIKAARTFQSSATNTAGGTTTGATFDLRTSYGCLLTATITNGSSGPTVACDFVVQVSNDNFSSDTKEVFRATSDKSNSASTTFSFEIPATVMYARSVFTGNTLYNVTVICTGHELTQV